MFNKHMKYAVVGLIIASAVIYILQILIFKDPQTTAFYLFQDMAFIPISVALTTVVLGGVLEEREKRQRAESTRMLTSIFYTQFGAELMSTLITLSDHADSLREMVGNMRSGDMADASMQEQMHAMALRLSIDEPSSRRIRSILEANKSALLTITSNPMIIEQTDFTNMVWGIFHLMDEFRLRGSYDQWSAADKDHINADLAKVLKMLLVNSVPNVQYLRKTYPDFYQTAKKKILHARKHS